MLTQEQVTDRVFSERPRGDRAHNTRVPSAGEHGHKLKRR